MTNLTPGKRYAVTFHGTAVGVGHLEVDDGGGYYLDCVNDAASIEQLPDPMPTWQVGDVIAWDETDTYAGRNGRVVSVGPTVRHVAMRIYTYGGTRYWRDAAAHPELGTRAEISDERVAELWDAGRLELVARDGRPWPKP